MRERLEGILSFFGLGRLLDFERAGGYTSANYFTATESGAYLIKVSSPPYDEADQRRAQAYLARLTGAGFSAVPYLIAPSGDFIYRDGDVFATAQRKLDADAPLSLTPEMAGQLGAELARLHLIPYEGMPERQSWLRPAYLEAVTAEAAERHADADRADEIIADCRSVRKTWDGMPDAIRHGDLFIDNALFRDVRLVCLIDWEQVDVGPSILDVGMAVYGCCFLDDGFDSRLADAFMDSYEAVRPLFEDECEALPEAVRYAFLTCSVWRLVNRERLGDRYRRYWTQGLDRQSVP